MRALPILSNTLFLTISDKLFKNLKTPYDFANASNKKIEELIRPTGFFQNKVHIDRIELRQHAQSFIVGAGRNEHVNFRSSIRALPEVPTMTLNALEENRISTIIDKLIQCNTRKLMQTRKFGKYGLRKLTTSFYHMVNAINISFQPPVLISP